MIYVPDPIPESVFVISAYELGPKAKRAIRRKRRKKPLVLKNIRADGMRREFVAFSSITNRKVMKKLRPKLKPLLKAPRWKCPSLSCQKYVS